MKIFSKLLIGLVGAFSIASAQASELVNLVTSEPGMHRISYEQLTAQGADLAGVKHGRLGLSLNGEPVQLKTTGQLAEHGKRRFFGAGGYIEFYVEPKEDLYTTDQVFTLHLLNRAQLVAGRKSIRDQRNRFKPNAPVSTVYQQTTVVEENNHYESLAPSETDPWHYGLTLLFRGNANTPIYDFELDNVADSATATVDVEMYGLLDFDIDGNDHDFEALINGQVIGDKQFDGVSKTVLSVGNVPVNSGTNTVKYNYRPIADVPFDRIVLNKVTLSYSRNTVATDGYLEGYFDAAQSKVFGVGDGVKASVYRRDVNGTITRIIGTRLTADGATAFNTGNVAADYIVVAQDEFKAPVVSPIFDENDIKSGSAEYLVIAHHSLMGGALNELVQIREQDYIVKVVDVRQVYAQFGGHVPSADSIQAYVKYAKENMGTRFVVLVGADSYDTKHYQSESISMVPTRYVSTPGGKLTVTQTPSDAAYGDTNGSGVPNIPVGRISTRTEIELAAVVEKIRDYRERSGYVGRVFVAADKDDIAKSVSFAEDAEDLIAAMPSDWGSSIREDFRGFPSVHGAQEAHDKLQVALNRGVSVVSYIGHSSQQSWSFASPPILRASEISNLTNVDKPYVVTQMGCWNTYYVDPNGNSMADQFLLAGEVGAVAVLGASTLTTNTEERAYGIELNRHLYTEGLTIGEAVVRAKKALAQGLDAPAIQFGYNIIGDPAIVVNN